MKMFISYARGDKDSAQELNELLEAHGIETWFDEQRLAPGKSWESQIKTALAESDAIVAVMPATGEVSPSVLVELGVALGQNKQVFPVAIGGNVESSVLANFANCQFIHTNDVEEAAAKISEFVVSK